jgi:hypothetical protein
MRLLKLICYFTKHHTFVAGRCRFCGRKQPVRKAKQVAEYHAKIARQITALEDEAKVSLQAIEDNYLNRLGELK